LGLDKRRAHGQHLGVELIAGSTIWCLFSCVLLFPLLELPARMRWAAMMLLLAEFVALGVWSYGSRGCTERPCSAAAETGRTAATIDVPLLALALIALAVLHVRRAVKRVS
jgi:hypothetical protein